MTQSGDLLTVLPAAAPIEDIRSLQTYINRLIPEARLLAQKLPQLPIDLWLIDPAQLKQTIEHEIMLKLWSETPYWIFCWGAGLAMSQWLIKNPKLVAGKTVLDFGCGSGVVAIAAAIAGAKTVYACDIDPISLAISKENARLNKVALNYLPDLKLAPAVDILLAADVLYDTANLGFLDQFEEVAQNVWVADSRVKNFSHSTFYHSHTQVACTWPDLAESDEFNQINFYTNSRSGDKH